MSDSRSVSSDRAYSSCGSSIFSSRHRPSEKLKKKANIISNILPPFMKSLKPLSIPKKTERSLPFTTGSPEETSPTSNTLSDPLFSEGTKEKTRLKKRSDYPDSESVSLNLSFFDFLSGRQAKEKVLKYGSLFLTAEEVLNLKSGKNISRNTIDFCLSIFQKINKDLLRKAQDIMKSLISSTSFSWKIFNDRQYQNIHFPEFCYFYHVLLFPVFIGYWSILVVWTDENKVFFYDVGTAGAKYLKDILINCYRFLSQEFAFFGDSQIMKKLNTLTYEKTVNRTEFTEEHSELFILMVAKCCSVDVSRKNYELEEELSKIDQEDFIASLFDIILNESENLNIN